LYSRVKQSSVYDLYWRFADPEIIRARTDEVGFYRDVLAGFRPGDIIFDVGANQGTKTDVFLRLGARVVAIDPDEANQRKLEQRFLRYRLKRHPVLIVDRALSDVEGTETFWIDAPGSAKNTLNPKWVQTLRTDTRFGQQLDYREKKQVRTTTLEHLIVNHGVPYFVKIDVEGFEPQVLRGLKTPVPYLSYEVNLPDFRAEGLECVELLARVSKDGRFNFVVECSQGLVLPQWLDASGFSDALATCREPSIEVFWKTAR
jgi:FkbM family methyltransferase